MQARGKIVGALSFAYSESQRQYVAADLALAEEIGRRAATAIDNARLFEETQLAVAAREEILAIVSHDLKNPLAAPKGIEIHAQLDGHESVLCDRERMGQVFSNLLGNAAKYTSERGEISVTAQVAGAEMLFTVADTGPGIPVEQHAHVFNKYWQAPDTAKLGTGLGLFITRGIIAAHGGRIWVEAASGAGAVFKFTLPLLVARSLPTVPSPG